MDSLLNLVFEYIQSFSSDKPTLKTLFRIFQKTFEKSIMLTHRSKYTQFILFFICQFDASFVERFVGRLVDWSCSEEASLVTRQTCCAYCASFVCRATFVSIDIVRSVLYFSLTWVNKYIDGYDAMEKPLHPGDPGHLVFYSLSQAVCYIVCFSSRRFERESAGLAFLRRWDWTRILNSPLDPLRVGLPRECHLVLHLLGGQRVHSHVSSSGAAARAGDQQRLRAVPHQRTDPRLGG